MSSASHGTAATPPDPLIDALARLRPRPRSHGFGTDVDEVMRVCLSDTAVPVKEAALRDWFAKSQPCVFGKVAARPGAVPALDVCWIDDADIARGADHVRGVLQSARRRWKRRALEGLTSSLQVVFASERLAFAEPSPELVEAFLVLVGLYLPEWAPIEADTICLDGIPLRRSDGSLELFAASMTTFFAGAHLTAFHDHRAPAGLVLNVNAIGHHTWATYDAGRYASKEAALRRSHVTALRSVGNGGYGRPDGRSSTWHTRGGEPCARGGSGRTRRPGYVPDGADEHSYGAAYHIDVTVSSDYGRATHDTADATAEGWTIMLDYFDLRPLPDYHNAALMHGVPISAGQVWDAPWAPVLRSPQRREF